jgi:hypothetical protein
MEAPVSMRSAPRWVAMLPIWVAMAWLLGTVVLFAAGPYEYQLSNAIQLYVYLGAVHLALYVGYIVGSRIRIRYRRPTGHGPVIARLALGLGLLATAFGLVYTGGGDLARIGLALRQPELAYYAGSTKEGITAFNYVEILSAPFVALAITLGIFHWSSLTRGYRLAVCLLAAIILASAVGAAVRGPLVQFGVLSVAALAAAVFSGELKVSRRGRLLIVSSALAGIVAFAEYTAFITENRAPNVDMLYNPITGERPRPDHYGYAIVPEEWHLGYTSAAFYVSHGYARLARALEMTFLGSGFGMGNSPFLIRNVVRVTGWSELEERSYGLRLDKEVFTGEFGILWSTIFTWMASDVTFPGTVLVVFVIGMGFGLSWVEALLLRSPLAVAAFSCLAFIVFSFPMNNPLQDGPGIAVFLCVPVAWLCARRPHIRGLAVGARDPTVISA